MTDSPLASEYRLRNLYCELFEHLDRDLLESIFDPVAPQRSAYPVLHHIWQRRGPHSDCRSNFLMVCDPIHRWLHVETVLGHVVCSWVNRRKGEMNLDDLRLSAGFSVSGWLDTDKVRTATESVPWIDEMRLDLLETL